MPRRLALATATLFLGLTAFATSGSTLAAATDAPTSLAAAGRYEGDDAFLLLVTETRFGDTGPVEERSFDCIADVALDVAAPGVDPHGPGRHVVVADHQHVGQLLGLGPADPLAQRVVGLGHLDPVAGVAQATDHRAGVVVVVLRYGQHLDLDRGQPQREVAGEVLDLDGPIGGFNFQAAFSTGWLAGTKVATTS